MKKRVDWRLRAVPFESEQGSLIGVPCAGFGEPVFEYTFLDDARERTLFALALIDPNRRNAT